MGTTGNTPLEAVLESYFRKRVRLLGGYCVKLAPTEAGVPDRWVVFPGGRTYLVELKTVTGALSPIQSAWHRKIRRYGVRVHVLYGTEGINTWLRMITEAAYPARKPYTRRISA